MNPRELRVEDIMIPRFTTALCALALASVCVFPPAVRAQSEAYVATGVLKTAGGATLTVPVTIAVSAWTTEGERDRLTALLKSGGGTALRPTLESTKTVGRIGLGAGIFEAKYAFALPSSKGRIITLVVPKPMFYVGAGAPAAAKPKAGHEFGVLTIEVDEKGRGTGTVTPAASLRLSDTGALVVEDFSSELLTLPDVKRP